MRRTLVLLLLPLFAAPTPERTQEEKALKRIEQLQRAQQAASGDLLSQSTADGLYQPKATGLTNLAENCTLEDDSTPIPDACVGDGSDGGGSGGVDTANSPNANEFARFTDADTIEGRTTSEVKGDLGLGTAAEADTGDFAAAAHDHDADYDVLGAAAAAEAASQPLDSDLTTWGGLTPSAFFQTLVDDADQATARTTLGALASSSYSAADVLSKLLTVDGSASGLDADLLDGNSSAAFQTADSDLTSWAGVTRASGFDTFAATPSAANLASLVTGESYGLTETDLARLIANCDLENDSTPIPDSCVGDGSDAGGGSGAPTDADYLVGTANGSLSAEIVVGTSPGGELGGTWASPTVDDSVGVTDWTLTSPNIAAGSATASSWPNLTAGTLLTTPEDGALELDANSLYFTTDAGNRGNIPVRHIIRANATRTLPNDTNENPIFNSPANGRLTLETGTYTFKMLIGVTGMSATSGNALVDILGAGTATVNDWLWGAVGKDGTLIGVAAVQGVMPVIQSTPASMFTAGNGTELWFTADGTFTVTGAGTLIPSIDLVTASAAVVAIGSYFMCERIGDTSLTFIGQWD